ILTRLEQLQPQGHKIRELECYFCSKTGHGIQECPQVEPSIRAGKCTRNANGRIVLPTGARIPNNIPGSNLLEKIEECHRRNFSNQATNHTTNETVGSLFYETRSTRAPSATAAAFDRDEQLSFRKQRQRLGAHNVPAPTSTATPFKPSRFHEPNVAAPVSTFHMSITPWPAPAESKTTPVKLTRASNSFNSINYPDYRTTPFPATIRPPPDSRPSTPARPTTLQTPPIDSAYPVGCRTPVPATHASPSPSVTSHFTAVNKPTQFSPSSDPSTSPEPTHILRTPASTTLASSLSVVHAPVSRSLSFSATPLPVSAALSENNSRRSTPSYRTTASPTAPVPLPSRSHARLIETGPTKQKTRHVATFEEFATMPVPEVPAADPATTATSTAAIEFAPTFMLPTVAVVSIADQGTPVPQLATTATLAPETDAVEEPATASVKSTAARTPTAAPTSTTSASTTITTPATTPPHATIAAPAAEFVGRVTREDSRPNSRSKTSQRAHRASPTHDRKRKHPSNCRFDYRAHVFPVRRASQSHDRHDNTLDTDLSERHASPTCTSQMPATTIPAARCTAPPAVSITALVAAPATFTMPTEPALCTTAPTTPSTATTTIEAMATVLERPVSALSARPQQQPPLVEIIDVDLLDDPAPTLQRTVPETISLLDSDEDDHVQQQPVASSSRRRVSRRNAWLFSRLPRGLLSFASLPRRPAAPSPPVVRPIEQPLAFEQHLRPPSLPKPHATTSMMPSYRATTPTTLPPANPAATTSSTALRRPAAAEDPTCSVRRAYTTVHARSPLNPVALEAAAHAVRRLNDPVGQYHRATSLATLLDSAPCRPLPVERVKAETPTESAPCRPQRLENVMPAVPTFTPGPLSTRSIGTASKPAPATARLIDAPEPTTAATRVAAASTTTLVAGPFIVHRRAPAIATAISIITPARSMFEDLAAAPSPVSIALTFNTRIPRLKGMSTRPLFVTGGHSV
ncbi:hypothetical protein H0H81_004127, partial [Sphagnurus paluster]